MTLVFAVSKHVPMMLTPVTYIILYIGINGLFKQLLLLLLVLRYSAKRSTAQTECLVTSPIGGQGFTCPIR